jgi:hypothetical protein
MTGKREAAFSFVLDIHGKEKSRGSMAFIWSFYVLSRGINQGLLGIVRLRGVFGIGYRTGHELTLQSAGTTGAKRGLIQ